jgi:hypothetical protein
VDISSVPQEQLDHGRIPASRSNVQRCPAVGISGVDIGPLRQQRPYLPHIACFCGRQQLLASDSCGLVLTPEDRYRYRHPAEQP